MFEAGSLFEYWRFIHAVNRPEEAWVRDIDGNDRRYSELQ